MEIKKPKTLSVVTGSDRLNKEILCNGLPPVDRLVNAIFNLDEDVLSAEAVRDLAKSLVPDFGTEAQLKAARQADPDTPWEKLEGYMWALMDIPACELRLKCWEFTRICEEDMAFQLGNLQKVESIMDVFRNAKTLPLLLGQVLAIGNFINAGNARLGEADGYHVQLLGRPGGLDVMKDPKGKDIRQLIFKAWFEKYPEEARQLLEDFGPVFANTNRCFKEAEDEVEPCKTCGHKEKKSDGGGGERFNKSTRLKLEQMDGAVVEIVKEFDARVVDLRSAQQMIEDPSDLFKLRMPELFSQAEHKKNQLVSIRDSCKMKFADITDRFVAKEYKHSSREGTTNKPMTSDVWFLLWDEFFIASTMIDGMNSKLLQTVVVPFFVKDVPITVDSLSYLWGLKVFEPEKPKKKLVKQKTGMAAVEKAKEKATRQPLGKRRKPGAAKAPDEPAKATE